MLVRNNPDIDFDLLEQDIARRLDLYRDALAQLELPAYDAERLLATEVDHGGKLRQRFTGGLKELYALEDEEFVHAAYNFILGRTPETEELDSCTNRLRRGESKAWILCDLRYSEEGKANGSKIRLRRTNLIYKLSTMPLLGGLVSLFLSLLSLPRLKQNYLASMNHYHRVTESLGAGLEHQTLISQQRYDHIGETLQQLDERLRNCEQRLPELESDARQIRQDLESETRQLRGDLDRAAKAIASDRTRLTLLEQQPAAATSTAPAQPVEPAPSGSSQIDDAFYLAFEDRYRGAEEAVRERLGYYIPIVKEALSAIDSKGGRRIIDLGCGRGEWLQLLRDNDLSATGIDTNRQNIVNCEEKQLSVLKEDAISWLASEQSDSIDCISAFHLIEHLPFEKLLFLIDNAMRCLRPGGLILLETPNPENLNVGANTFYLDPSHIKPLPLELMEFVLSYKGFENVTVHRLNPADSAEMVHEDSETTGRLNHVLYGARDYAVSATRPRG